MKGLRIQRFCNPKGIVSSSPGLRGTSYPGSRRGRFSTPTGLCHVATDGPQPRLGLLGGGAVSQGSSCLATLGFEPESLWDSALEFPKGIRIYPAELWRSQFCRLKPAFLTQDSR